MSLNSTVTLTEPQYLTNSEKPKNPPTKEELQLPPLFDEQPTLQNWYKHVDWVNAPILVISPLVAIYGILTTELVRKTLIWTIIYYFITGISITAGYHRYFSHRAFSASPLLQWIIAFTGGGAVQGSINWWARGHRAHHRYTDTDKDPYNSHRGFWYAHLGWMIFKRSNSRIGRADIADLKANKIVQFQHVHYPWFAVGMGIVFPWVVAGLGWGDWRGGYFYAGVVRMVLCHHATFCINSLAHWLGSASFDDAHTPRDNVITALVTMGEGYHNFHHEFPQDYRNALKFYQYDPTKWLIRGLAAVGLAYDLKECPENEIKKGKIHMTQKKLDQMKRDVKWGKPLKELAVVSWDEYQDAITNKGQKWILVEGILYDVAEFMSEHPGGESYIKYGIGRDMTAAFNGGVYNHSNAARNQLSRMRVGVLSGGMEVESMKANPTEVVYEDSVKKEE
ncbi:omega9 fatty acid desaturase [Basidiobolus meristosporus CBS 931.73]|uniref:Acyl-CoA desaturase n=1 Tax=Basidiobolus meristosporus CBS 931.73 TaxID=1314790 RepID=A0A1Y1YMJ6_9FUNG|nr:omega9 fatty acid desaturase [Basidiobolus meristosporus CBS 931.73]|eukprot:ORX99237.1 omega9 fatty acid desaturase [Basidiobolus meristosporus CBS 931.73]